MKKDNYKTSVCRHFQMKGVCSLYNNCHFAHGEAQLRKRVDPVPQKIPPVLKPISIYKTQLCKYFMSGYCRNSSMCPFAHGQNDIHGMIVMSIEEPKPDYGEAGEFLMSILRNLSQVFPEDTTKTVKIKMGLEKCKEGDIHLANQIITQIVGDASLPQKQKEQCQTILQNAYSLHKMNFNPF